MQSEAFPLYPRARFVVNGAVLSIAADNRSFSLENEGLVLREDEIMQEEEAATPARRLYFAIQLIGLDQTNADRHYGRFIDLAADYMEGAVIKDVRRALILMRDFVQSGCIREALTACRALIAFEAMLLPAEAA